MTIEQTECVVKLKYHKPLAELNWLFEKHFKSPSEKSVKKVENWLKVHNDIPAYEIPNDIMKLINSFDVQVYGQIKKRFM